ncbi:ABC transporter substrate-binding protein [Halobium salinum]|uniref:ABC transporter substrate-binding protein n=1 Tax=Halobium salinum TaxID=1364940 RepID=A0ABD5P6X7_9EURY|nr:ABC transporter substrate-binding protein [Halobium salinum]
MDDNGQHSTRRQFLKTAAGAGSAMAIAGCAGSNEGGGSGNGSTNATGGETTGTDAGTTEQGDGGGGGGSATLDLINSTMSSLDPVGASDTASGWVTSQVFDGLMTYPDGAIPVEPVIAEGYETSDDYRTYTFTLKEGVTFHDGSEVTAQDFVYSYERLAGSDNSQQKADILSAINVVHETTGEGAYEPGSLAVEAVDDYTFQMEISEPFAPTLQVLSNNQFAAVPEGIVGDIEGYDGEMSYEEFATSNPIGAGPFQFEVWEQGTQASVTAYDDYHGSAPDIDGVHWQIIEDSNAMYNYAMNENADAFEIPTSKFDPSKLSVEGTDDKGRKRGTYGPLRNGKQADYIGVPTLSVYYMGFNMEAVEKPVRQAVAYALNQQTVVEQVFKDRGVPAYHYTTPSIYPGGAEAYTQHAEENYPYGYNETQLDEARRVMEEAGYSQSDPYELEFLIYDSKTWMQTAQLLRDQLQSAHVELSITRSPFSAMLSRVENMDMEMYSLAWIVPWAAPDAFVKHLNPAKSGPEADTFEAYNNWPTDTETAQRAIDAWNRITENRDPSDESENVRAEAAVTMEEANWEAVANLPVYHEIEERFSYQNVEIPPYGSGGAYKQKLNDATMN